MKSTQRTPLAAYRLYFLLAFIAVLTVAGALTLQYRIARLYQQSLQSTQEFAGRSAAFDRVRAAAADLGASTEDIFETGNPAEERNDLRVTRAAFDHAVAALRHSLSTVHGPEAARLQSVVGSLQLQGGRVAEHEAAIVDLYEKGNETEASMEMLRAAHEMKTMRRLLDEGHEVVVSLNRQSASDRHLLYASIRRSEEIGLGLMAVALAGIALYGSRQTRDLIRAQERERLVADLQRRTSELRDLNEAFENAVEGVSFIGTHACFTFVNPAFAKMLGYDDPHEIVGRELASLIEDADQPLVAQAMEETADAKKVEREIRAVRRDGSTAHLRVSFVRANSERGVSLGTYAFVKDFTAEHNAVVALRKSEERFNLAVQATNDVIWECDLVTGRVWVSPAIRTVFGHEPSTELGMDGWMKFVHRDDAEELRRSLDIALASGARTWNFEHRFRRADATWANVLDRVYIVRSESGAPVRLIAAMLDVTERKRSDEAILELSRKNQMILDTMADGAYGIDSEGRTTFINESALAMLGWSVDELLGKPIHDFIHLKHADGSAFAWTECSSYRALTEGKAVTNAHEAFWRKDGRSIPVEYSTRIMRDREGKPGAVVTFRDITERREIERMKDEFVSVVSHELRTPLTSIRGALGLIAGGRTGEIPDRAKRMLDIAVSNTDRLVRLINDILDIERMESGKVTLSKSRCTVDELFAQVLDIARPLAEKADIRVEAEACGEVLHADSDRLVQTLTNLVTNAIKFSPASTTVTMSARVDGDNVLFDVADHGRGIPADKLEAIFERFQQVDTSDSREKGGSGLGLPICRSIVRQHGGEIWAESVLGAGSRFRFTIPRPAPSAPVKRDRTILICDDDLEIREMLAAILESNGYRAVQFESGEELVARAASFEPDVILLDLLMPGVDGWETLERLRAQPALREVPVIVVSIFSAHVDFEREGLAGWVQKPLQERPLIEALEHALHLGGRKPMVMLVEDDEDLARVISESFRRRGIETIHAPGGNDAIRVAQQVQPDLLILDLVLPDIDGFGVVDWLKDHDRLRGVPMVVYSAAEPTPAQRDRLKLGPTEFLTKSRVSPDEFEEHVIHLLDTLTTKGAIDHVA